MINKLAVICIIAIVFAILFGCSDRPAHWVKQAQVIPPPIPECKNTVMFGEMPPCREPEDEPCD